MPTNPLSTELSMELTPDALAVIARDPDVAVVATARPVGAKGLTSLGVCEFTHRDSVIGVGTVCSVHIRIPGAFPEPWGLCPAGTRPTELGDIMALCVEATGTGAPQLFQSSHPALNNTMGIVHGGVAAAGLELAASAALNQGRSDAPLHTAP